MKKLLLKLAGGVALAAGFVLVSATGASASSGYDGGGYGGHNNDCYQSCKHEEPKYQHKVHYQKSHYQQPKHYTVHKADYQKHNSCNNDCGYVKHSNYQPSHGFWWNGKWYEYNKIGYWKYGKWVSYHNNWNDYDWKEWQKHCY